MHKIFGYECRRLLCNKFFLGLLLVLLFYGWLVLNGVTILGVSHTAPFSPWSFGDYLSRMLPLQWIGTLFFLTFFTSSKARRVAVLTAATQAPPRRYALGPMRRRADGDLPAGPLLPGGGRRILWLVLRVVWLGEPSPARSDRAPPSADLCPGQRMAAWGGPGPGCCMSGCWSHSCAWSFPCRRHWGFGTEAFSLPIP